MLAIVVLDVGCGDWVILVFVVLVVFLFFNKMVDFFFKIIFLSNVLKSKICDIECIIK